MFFPLNFVIQIELYNQISIQMNLFKLVFRFPSLLFFQSFTISYKFVLTWLYDLWYIYLALHKHKFNQVLPSS